MGTYIVGMISTVVISTMVLIYILKRNNLLNFNLVAAIGISSIIICVGVPVAFSRIVSMEFKNSGFGPIISLLITILIYVTCVLVTTVIISLFITDKKAKVL
mgnify:CR=1 FL=1